jgi:hypothetical protein
LPLQKQNGIKVSRNQVRSESSTIPNRDARLKRLGNHFDVIVSVDVLQFASSYLAALTGVCRGRSPRLSMLVGFHF